MFSQMTRMLDIIQDYLGYRGTTAFFLNLGALTLALLIVMCRFCYRNWHPWKDFRESFSRKKAQECRTFLKQALKDSPTKGKPKQKNKQD